MSFKMPQGAAEAFGRVRSGADLLKAMLCALSLWAAAPPAALAAPADCMGTAPDGTARCTAPLITPQRYGICIQTGFAYPDNALDRCYTRIVGAGNPMTSSGQANAVVNCLPPETYGPNTPPGSVVLAWTGEGESLVDNNLCWSITTTYRYGVEMDGWARATAQELQYGWNVIARRVRQAVCPRGYLAVGTDSNYPDYCIKPTCATCGESVGNPLSIATAEKKVFESDFSGGGTSALRFSRSYSNYGHYRPMAAGSGQSPGFGDFWRHSYSHRLLPEGSGSALWATVLRPNGSEKHFRPDGKEVLNIDGRAGDVLSSFGNGGWLYRVASGGYEVYASNGSLVSLTDTSGKRQTLTYSDASTPAAVAPEPGLLLRVEDAFGRSLNFTYDAASRLKTMTDPAGGVYRYGFDDSQMLTRVDYPDGSFRTYLYNEPGPWASAGGPYAISGIFDENGARYATYRYRDGYWNTPDSTEHGAGVEKYTRYPNGSNAQGEVISVTDPQGATRNYTVATVGGVSRVIGETQPGGSGSGASSSARSLDASGNVTSSDDFNGSRTCRTFDAATNLEASRVEGLPNSTACSTVSTAGSSLPSGSRRISMAWHPDWPLEVRRAEPGRLTTWVYNGQPDPFAGGAAASCAPAGAVLPDGKPIAVLCKEVVRATTDADGRLGLNPGYQAGVANRTRSWTYNALGQVLTAKDPLNNTTTYAYYADTTADHTTGDLQSVTNAKGQVVNYTRYGKVGQLLESSDPNGTVTANTYDSRQRLLSTSVGGQSTGYSYDPAGQLLRITQADGTYVGFEYDEAHRRTAIFDSKGNRVDYTLDNMGNKTAEVVKDPNGVLSRNLGRVYDVLNRLQSVTGARQ